MRFDDRVTGNARRPTRRARKKIHVDIDPAEINKNVQVDVGLIGDLREVLEALLPRRDAATITRRWLAHIDDLQRRRGGARHPELARRRPPLRRARHPRPLARHRAATALVVTDVGQHQMWEAQYYRHESPRSLITSGGLGTMGFALPAAIGAKIARPDAEVWAVVGDGGFQMTMAELAPIVQEGIKINIAIINNGYLGMVRQWQEFFYERALRAPRRWSTPTSSSWPSAYGIRGVARDRARRASIPAVARRAAHDGPVLHRLPGRAGGRGVPDGAGRRRSARR